MERRSICALGLLALAACDYTTPGIRAGTGGFCPEGEDCSASTPQGLYFQGAFLSDCLLFCDGDIKTTAVGGTQEITAYEDEWADVAFDRSFDAAILGDSFAVAEVSPPEVTVSALSADWSVLRIVEPDTDELFDRVSVNAASLDYVLARPAGAAELGLVDDLTQWAIYAEHASLVIALHDEHGGRLVDESMEVGLAADAVGSLMRDRWDRVSLAGLQPGTVALSVTAGEWAELPLELDVVGSVDTIEPIADMWDDPAQPIPVGRSASYCFRGLSGGVPVAGLDWAFSSPDVEVEPTLLANCAYFHSEQVGTITLVVLAANARLTLEIEVVESEETSARRAPPHAIQPARAAAPGQRANAG